MVCQSICKCIFALSIFMVWSSNRSGAQPSQEITNSIGMKLVLIHKGTFLMGSPPGVKNIEGRDLGENNQHEVTLTKDYYLGVYEVTQAQYEKVTATNPGDFVDEITLEDSANYPVVNVTWEEAVAFCEKLSALPEEKEAGRKYRLPTEAEWEYACRAGSTTNFYFHDDYRILNLNAWYRYNSSERTHSVGRLNPNAWGLFDMHGNAREWCSDGYEKYTKDAVSDPKGLSDRDARIRNARIIRGGGFESWPNQCRSGFRDCGEQWRKIGDVGFRVVVSPTTSSQIGNELTR